MKKIITILTVLTITGCITNDPEIKAPSHMKSTAKHLYKSIPACFKDNGISSKKYDCDVTIKTTPATAVHRGHPVFDYNGSKVGGITSGSCGSKSKITIAQNGDQWSPSVLHHEMCHAYDICGPCRKGHPGEYATCCPHWPYLRSLEAVDGLTCISVTVDGVDHTITVFGDEEPKIMTHDWYRGLINYVGHGDVIPAE